MDTTELESVSRAKPVDACGSFKPVQAECWYWESLWGIDENHFPFSGYSLASIKVRKYEAEKKKLVRSIEQNSELIEGCNQ